MKKNGNLTRELAIDHLLIGTPDLDLGCQWVADLFGVEPVAGGSHPGHGTRNALLGLENDVYIEILAPDPEQSKDLPTSYYLRKMEQPSLMWWAARCQDFDHISNLLQIQNISIKSRGPWCRLLPDGQELKWELLIPGTSEFQTALPFFIDWKNMQLHPSRNLPVCGALNSLKINHPATEKLQLIMGSTAQLNQQPTKQLRAELDINGKIITLETPTIFPKGVGETE